MTVIRLPLQIYMYNDSETLSLTFPQFSKTTSHTGSNEETCEKSRFYGVKIFFSPGENGSDRSLIASVASEVKVNPTTFIDKG